MFEIKIKTSKNQIALYNRCVLGVSLDSNNHRGDRLAALVEWANDNFKDCIVDLTDTLHRYNHMADLKLSENDARLKAHIQGDQWLQESYHILSNFKIPYCILRWDAWKYNHKFIRYLHMFESAFAVDKNFREAVMYDVNLFLGRRKALGSPTTEQLCVTYLLEELAGQSLLYEQFPAAEIYPGKQQKSFGLVRAGKVPNVPTGLQNSCFVSLYLHDKSAGLFGSANDDADFADLRKMG
ncbi:MAG: tRNA-dependent cyclodipeptide synthase [Alphaproteobacteria bacterium]|nr:MAG: tRNA-dependent cyclodipeptide synthase [Alphaproteobacteria bacterium]